MQQSVIGKTGRFRRPPKIASQFVKLFKLIKIYVIWIPVTGNGPPRRNYLKHFAKETAIFVPVPLIHSVSNIARKLFGVALIVAKNVRFPVV